MTDYIIETNQTEAIKHLGYPTWLKWIAGILLYLNAINVLITGLQLAVMIFEESLGLGLILVLTGIGFLIIGGPITAAFLAPSIILDALEYELTNWWEFTAKSILYFIMAVFLPYILLLIVGFFVAAILNF